MADWLKLTIYVPIESEEEANMFARAVESGLASEILRMGVIRGQMPLPGTPAFDSLVASLEKDKIAQSDRNTVLVANGEDKSKESTIELKPVETKVGKLNLEVKGPLKEEQPHKRKGLAGRTRRRPL